jgi:C1A family cysteine protease
LSWSKTKYVGTNTSCLKQYFTSNGLGNNISIYKGYPGHALVIKGYDQDYMGSGIPCYFIQNSWGDRWNNGSAGGRWISSELIELLSYEVTMIVPSETGFGIRKKKTQKRKTNKRKERKTRRI